MRMLEFVLRRPELVGGTPKEIIDGLRLPPTNHVAHHVDAPYERILVKRDVSVLADALLRKSAGIINGASIEANLVATASFAEEWFLLPNWKFWLEIECPLLTSGFLVDANTGTFRQFVSGKTGGQVAGVRTVMTARMEVRRGYGKLAEPKYVEGLPKDDLFPRWKLGNAIAVMSFMTSLSLVTIRKVGGDRRRGAARLVRSKFSAEVFSHNRVDLTVPREVQVINGEAVLTERPSGVRLHEVGAYMARRGPMKVWTPHPAHPRGNSALGRVVKSKTVKAAA